jgi:hypothetical protein
MSDFWVYENWLLKRMRIHRGICRYCNNGTGWKPSDSGEYGKWHGPYSSHYAAADRTKAYEYWDVQDCAICSRSGRNRYRGGAIARA